MTTLEFAGGKLLLHKGPIARLILNQPEKRNALSQSMWQALPEICDAIDAAPEIRVVLVAGSGGKAFSAGADISEFEAIYATPDRTHLANDAIRHAQARLRAVGVPTIAMIEGACVGGGMGVALACDFRFAGDTATFAITPAKLGLAYSFLDTAQLVEKVGPVGARDILYSARLFNAAEAKDMRLIERVYAPQDLEAETLAYAETLAGLSRTSIATSKAIINGIADSLAAHSGNYDGLFEASFSSPDFQEGYRAFLEKRKPVFK